MINQFVNCIPEIEYFIERKCINSWKIEQDMIDFHDLTYVVKGKATYQVDSVDYEVNAGDLIYIPPKKVRAAKVDEENLMTMFSTNFNWLYPKHCKEILPFDIVTNIGFSRQLKVLYSNINQLWLEKKDGYIMEARALFIVVLSSYLNKHFGNMQSFQTDTRIQKVKWYILNNFEKQISVETLAEYIHLSPNYLGSIFKTVEGCSLNQYINKVRINNAEGLITSENTSVTEAAELCGFADVFYFSKVFKQLKGYPPTQARHGNIKKDSNF